ncbi:MAG: YceI family protein [Burkholderiales bacterium]|nr:YceI family protein [Burkholderiales bacterium]MDE1927653.1 YceI family protein [Burkholderiales bacterium]MDE2158031.1 YceI family protein [Burkholderiales bacterium]MDE2503862.1 YceI family protein [Burkholderiales bacterium]
MNSFPRIVLGAALAASLAASAATRPAQLVPAGSEIDFTTKQMGVPVDGKFGKFSAQIVLDPKHPQSGSVAFTIDTGSARFGTAELDAEVPKATWLDVAKFPQASFKSTAIKAAGPGRFEVAGVLSIKGQSHPVVVPVQITQTGANSVASGSFAIQRLAFKVGEGEWADTSMLADDVQVRFKLQLAGLAPL